MNISAASSRSSCWSISMAWLARPEASSARNFSAFWVNFSKVNIRVLRRDSQHPAAPCYRPAGSGVQVYISGLGRPWCAVVRSSVTPMMV